MANHRVPGNSDRIEQVHGVNDDGDVVTVAVFRHVRRGHSAPEFYVVGYREAGRRIDRGTRWTRQYSGARAAERLEEDMADVRRYMAESRVRAAAALAA